MDFLTLPPEIRAHIYSFSFPSPKSHITVVPYDPSSPECQFHLPLSLYGVCKAIYNELSPLPKILRTLDLVYIVNFNRTERTEREPYDIIQAKNFERMTRFAECIRVVGREKVLQVTWGEQLSSSWTKDCVVRTIEVQPFQAYARTMWIAVNDHLKPMIRDPDVLMRLEWKLIREGYQPHVMAERSAEKSKGELDQLEEIFRGWVRLKKPAREWWNWLPESAYRRVTINDNQK